MKANTPVAKIDLEKNIFEILDESLAPVYLRSGFKEPCVNDYGVDIHYQENYDKIISFLSHRVLSLDRKNAKQLLNAYHFTQSQSPVEKAKIAIACRAVSMTDDYWIKTEEQDDKWENLNPQHTALSEIVTQIMLTGSSLTLQGYPTTPELTGKGTYAHAWKRETNGNFLYKKSTKDGIESDIEIMTSQILDCFNVPHVEYLSASYQGEPMCKCKNLASDTLSVVPASELFSYCNQTGKDFLQEALRIDAENIYKMCIVDYLISNTDRHIENWGFYMDNTTGKLLGCHPLFDHNNAFDEKILNDINGAESQIFLGKSQKEAALYSIKRCNFSALCQIPTEVFLRHDMAMSFAKKAEALGIAILPKQTFLQKLHIQKKQPFKLTNINNYNKVILPQLPSEKNENTYISDVQKYIDDCEQRARENRDKFSRLFSMPFYTDKLLLSKCIKRRLYDGKTLSVCVRRRKYRCLCDSW